MKKLLFVFTVTLLHILSYSQTSNAQSPYYYYYQGKKQYLSLNTEYAFLSLKEEQLPAGIKQRNINATTLMSDQSAKTQNQKGERESRFYTELKLQQKLSDEQYLMLLEDIKRENKDVIISPYFKIRENGKIGLSNFFYVNLKAEGDTVLLRQMAERTKSLIINQDQFMPTWFVLSTTTVSDRNALEIANIFHESGLFQCAEPDLMVKYSAACADINDNYFEQQWGLKNTGQYEGIDSIDIKACDAWQISTGKNVVVAVLDHGIESDHPDLSANIYPLNFDCASGTFPQIVHGSHGTACAGIIGAKQNNGEGITGVAPDCRLMAISHMLSSNPTIVMEAQQLASGINWAWKNGADIISNSWGSNDFLDNGSNYITTAIDSAVAYGRNGKGCVVVFSSGNFVSMWDIYNTYGVSYPANLSNVIAVGGVDRCGVRSGRIDVVPESCDPWPEYAWPGSCYGHELDVVAPGTNVLTTDRQGDLGYNTTLQSDHPDLDYTWFGGTSAACPHVAGVAALILSVNPELDWYEVKSIIKHTAQKIRSDLYYYTDYIPGHTDGLWHEQVGYGLVNAYDAVEAALATCTVDLDNDSIDDTRMVKGCVVNVNNVTLTGSADVTISGSRRVEITSLQMEDGSSLVVNNGVPTIQSSASPVMASRAVTENALVEAGEAPEENTIALASKDSGARLYQNAPNPFTGKTTIGYYLPEDSGTAWLRIIDMNGITVKTVDIIASGEGTVVLDANVLPKGIYFYSLVVNDNIIDTKRMVVK